MLTRKGHRYFTKKDLLNRTGWTPKAIRRFIGQPDMMVKNRMYPNGPKIHLFSMECVLEVEKSIPFEDWLKEHLPRSEAALKAVETKKRELFEYIEGLDICLPQRSFAGVKQEAVSSYEAWRGESLQSGEALDRIIVNFLRHECTTYDQELRVLFGKVGVHEGCARLNQKIYSKIAQVYPHLKGECDRQMEVKSKRYGWMKFDVK